MNSITIETIIEVTKKHRAAARKNDDRFRQLVRAAHHDELVSRIGVPLKLRSCHLLRLFSPQYFDADGHLKEFADMVFDLDRRLSWLAMRILGNRVNRDPGLQLSIDWGDYPVELARQMDKADELAREVEKEMRKEERRLARWEAKHQSVLDTGQLEMEF